MISVIITFLCFASFAFASDQKSTGNSFELAKFSPLNADDDDAPLPYLPGRRHAHPGHGRLSYDEMMQHHHHMPQHHHQDVPHHHHGYGYQHHHHDRRSIGDKTKRHWDYGYMPYFGAGMFYNQLNRHANLFGGHGNYGIEAHQQYGPGPRGTGFSQQYHQQYHQDFDRNNGFNGFGPGGYGGPFRFRRTAQTPSSSFVFLAPRHVLLPNYGYIVGPQFAFPGFGVLM